MTTLAIIQTAMVVFAYLLGKRVGRIQAVDRSINASMKIITAILASIKVTAKDVEKINNAIKILNPKFNEKDFISFVERAEKNERK